MRILIKIGSALTKKDNHFNSDLIKQKVDEISRLHCEKNEIILVTSGAIACGMEIDKITERPKDTLALQLLSGKGQALLMKNYFELFNKNNIKTAQILLTHHNLDTQKEKENLINVLEAYLKEETIPVINENDIISKEEIEQNSYFSDNDILSSLLASLLKVDILLILTDVDGLFNKNPKKESGSLLIEEINEITLEVKEMASKETNSLGLGGMYSKILAAERLLEKKITTIIANGNKGIEEILSGKVKRTMIRKK